MDASAVLETLPGVFTTADYREAADVAPSSASRALKRLAERGLIARAGRGWWYSRAIVEPGEAAAQLVGGTPGLWAPGLERELDALYGDRPRRIGYVSALEAAGVAATSPLTVAASARESKRSDALGILHAREPERWLLAGARQVTKRTWISEPHRALLECAQFPRRAPRFEEYVGYAVCCGPPDFDPVDVRRLGVELGWRAGLRRIASLADGLGRSSLIDYLGGPPDEAWAQMAPSARRGDRWIELVPGRHRYPDSRSWVDAARRVQWCSNPDGLANEILT